MDAQRLALHALSIDSLRDPALKTLAIANAEHAPYGRAAEAALQHLSLYDRSSQNWSSRENIAQTAQYADSGNAELGLISLTSALTPHMQSAGHYILRSARRAIRPSCKAQSSSKNSPNAQAAHRFLDFLASAPIVHQLEAGGLAPAAD